MSTASPDTCADVLGVATHLAASCCEPYLEIASRKSRAWYAGERQPLSTTNSTPSAEASTAASRRAPRSAESSFATPGTSSSKTVVPSGTALSASPSAPRCRLLGADRGGAAVGAEGARAVEDDDRTDSWPKATMTAAAIVAIGTAT